MRDLRGAVPARLRVGGEWATFTGFERRKKDEECIDFVFGHSGGGWCVLRLYVFRTCELIGGNGTGRRKMYLSLVIRQTMGCSRVTIGLSLRMLTCLE